MFFRGIIPDARHWSRCCGATANAVNCVRGAVGGTRGGCAMEDVESVQVRFLVFCGRHFESNLICASCCSRALKASYRHFSAIISYLGD